jgi:surface carbohydrate biosynthesis protein
MRDVDVIWLIEHVARELDVACAVCYLAEQRYGMSFEILPIKTDAKYVSASYRPRIVAIPYGFNANNAHVRNFLPRWLEPIYLNLSWEQLFYKAYLTVKAPSDVWSRRHVIHHAWGDFYKEYLLANDVSEEHIFVNGQPAYMLYDEPYRRYFATRQEMASRFRLDTARKWIFFPENYGWGFKSQKDFDIRVRIGQFDRETLNTMSDFCRDSLKEVLQWVKDVASEGSVEFILRPRPATNQRDFEIFVRQVIGSLPERLHIIKNGTVREWIMASDIIVSSFSTSLIEAAVAGKPAHMVEPILIPDPLDADWYQHVTRISTREAFLSVCLNQPDQRSSQRLRTWARAELIARGDPISNLVDFLHDLCLPGALRPPIPTLDVVTAPQSAKLQPTFWRRLTNKLGSFLHSRQIVDIQQDNFDAHDARQDDFDRAEVNRRMAAFENVLSSEYAVRS